MNKPTPGPSRITNCEISEWLDAAARLSLFKPSRGIIDAIRSRLVMAEAISILIQDLKYTLQIIDAFHVELRGDERIPQGFCQGKIFVEWPEEIKMRLAKLEAK